MSASNIRCPGCHSELVVANVPAGCDVRCAVCGKISYGQLASERYAQTSSVWWSLAGGLGSFALLVLAIVLFFVKQEIASLVVCLLTMPVGAWAIFLGWRGLLKMRYQRVARRHWWAAMMGSLAGGFFGLMLGGVLSAFGLLIAIIIYSTEIADDPEASRLLATKVGQLHFPSATNIEPYQVRYSTFIFGRVLYRNHQQADQASVWIQLSKFPKWATVNRAQFQSGLVNEMDTVVPLKLRSEHARTNVQWRVDDQPLKVVKVVWHCHPRDDAENESDVYEHYYGLLDLQDRWTVAISLIHKTTTSGLTEASIQDIFQSYQLPASSHSPIADAAASSH